MFFFDFLTLDFSKASIAPIFLLSTPKNAVYADFDLL